MRHTIPLTWGLASILTIIPSAFASELHNHLGRRSADVWSANPLFGTLASTFQSRSEHLSVRGKSAEEDDEDEDEDDCGCVSGSIQIKKDNNNFVSLELPQLCFCLRQLDEVFQNGIFASALSSCGKSNVRESLKTKFKTSLSKKTCRFPKRTSSCRPSSQKVCDFTCRDGFEKKWNDRKQKFTCSPTTSTPTTPTITCGDNFVSKLNSKGTKHFCHCPEPFKLKRGFCVPAHEVHPSSSPSPIPLTCGPNFVKKWDHVKEKKYCHCPSPEFELKNGACVPCSGVPTPGTPSIPPTLLCGPNFVKKWDDVQQKKFCHCPSPEFEVKNGACVPCSSGGPPGSGPSPKPVPQPISCAANYIKKLDAKRNKYYCYCPSPKYEEQNGACVTCTSPKPVTPPLTCSSNFVKRFNPKVNRYYCFCPGPKFELKDGACRPCSGPRPNGPTPTHPECPHNFVPKLNHKGTKYYCDCPAPFQLKNGKCAPCDDPKPSPSPVPSITCGENFTPKLNKKKTKYICACLSPFQEKNGKCLPCDSAQPSPSPFPLVCEGNFKKMRNEKGMYYCGCPAPFKLDKDGKCEPCNDAAPRAQPQPGRQPQIEIVKRSHYANKQQEKCPNGWTACGVYGAALSTWACFNTRENLESCGGCAPGLESIFGSSDGVDCSAIEGVSDVLCRAGRCEVKRCLTGYKVNKTGDLCVPEGYFE